jgi:WD40 repeat protein
MLNIKSVTLSFRLCAVAERGERPSMHVFDLRTFRRKKTMTTSDLMAKDIVSMQFSEDNQLLLALSGAPDWSLMCWNWSRAKLIASTPVSLTGATMHKCMFSPLDSSVATVIGRDYVKFFRVGEKEIRQLQDNHMPGNNFISFCWMRTPDDHLIVGTEEGKIMLFRSGEFLTLLPISPGAQHPITCLTSILGGFVAGSSSGQYFYFSYDESKDQALFDHQFKLVKTISAIELCSGGLNHIAICPKDERLIALTSDGQLILAPAQNMATISATNLKYAITSFHGPKPVAGMDVAAKKPLIITGSKDSSLRIWNYKTHELDLVKIFPEEIASVAMHPTGLHCAVGFADKLRVYHILVDDLRLCMEVPIKACRECRFSNGGNLIAATNGNSILIFDFYTGEKVADLRGHNGKVRAVYWMPSGCHLLSCGVDGAVYLWVIDGAKRVGEFVQKGIMYTSVVNTANSVLMVGNDRSLRELSLPDLAPSKLHDAGLILTHIQVAISKNILFTSTFEYAKPGYIRAYPYPLSGDFDDYCCSSSQILRMRLTADENFLVSVDEQGLLCIMELHGRQDRFQRASSTAYPELLMNPDWSDEVLVTKAELDDCNTTVQELRTKVDELKLNNEYQLKLKDMNYSEKIKETTDKFIQELEIAKSRFEMLQEVRVDYEIEAIEKLKYMEEMHQNNVQNLETGFQAQIMELVDKYQKLVKERDAQVERLDEQRRNLVTTHERYVEELTSEFDSKLDGDHQARISLEEERHDLSKELYEIQDQLEDDIDTEIDNMRRKYEDKLAQSRETTLKYKGENGIMKKKSVLLQRDIEDQKDEIKLLQAKEKELHEQIKLLEKEVSAHKKEIKTRDTTIGEKEKRIYELKKKNQELDKFKFVLDFKIRELKQQIEPRQMEIMAMREKIKSMDNELEKFHKSNSALDNLIGELRAKIDSLQQEVKEKRINAKQLENIITACRSEVQSAMNFIQSPQLLVNCVQKIVMTYGSTDSVKPRVDPEVEEEYNRHREFLQKSIAELKKALEQGSMSHMATNNEIREKNMLLIAEINQQREINRQLKNNVQADIGRIRHLMQGMNMKRSKAQAQGQAPGGAAPGANTSLDSANITSVDNFTLLPHETNPDFIEPTDLLEKNRKRILGLRSALEDLLNRKQHLLSKAISREVLPPLENGQSNMVRKPSGGHIVPLTLPPISGNNNQLENESKVLELDDTLDDGHSTMPKMKTYATEYHSPRDEAHS